MIFFLFRQHFSTINWRYCVKWRFSLLLLSYYIVQLSKKMYKVEKECVCDIMCVVLVAWGIELEFFYILLLTPIQFCLRPCSEFWMQLLLLFLVLGLHYFILVPALDTKLLMLAWVFSVISFCTCKRIPGT